MGHALVPTPMRGRSQQKQLPERQRVQPQLCLKLDEPTDNDLAATLTTRMDSMGTQGRISIPKLNLPQDQAGKGTMHDDALVADLKELTRWADNCHRPRPG